MISNTQSIRLYHDTFYHITGSGRGSLIHVSSLDINSARGNLTVHFEGSIESALHAAPKLNVTIEKNLNGPWSTVPCINKIGSW